MNADTGPFLALVALLLAAIVLFLWRRRKGGQRSAEHLLGRWVLVDGSNVMHWQDGIAQLATIRSVAGEIAALGYVPGLVFDANAGWKLAGRYLHDADFARLLGLEVRQILVVSKGTQADPYLLQTARDFGARIVTNDRYRDWAHAYPEVLEPGFLIRGGLRDGKVWLHGLPAVEATR